MLTIRDIRESDQHESQECEEMGSEKKGAAWAESCKLFVCMTWEVGDVMQECSRWESLSNPGNDGHLDPGAAVQVLTEAQTLGVL